MRRVPVALLAAACSGGPTASLPPPPPHVTPGASSAPTGDTAGPDDTDAAEAAAPASPQGTNACPHAHAGADVPVTVGDVVHLDGTASSDPDGDPLLYHWAALIRPAASVAVLQGATPPAHAARPHFTVDAPGTYVVQLRVEDPSGCSSMLDSVTYTAFLP